LIVEAGFINSNWALEVFKSRIITVTLLDPGRMAVGTSKIFKRSAISKRKIDQSAD